MHTLDTAILIGSFEPLHAGHIAALGAALDAADRVLVLIGSAAVAPSIRHPWSFAEREQMVRAALDEQSHARVQIVPLPDRLYDDSSWERSVREIVARHIAPSGRVGIIASRWSQAFAHWQPIPVAPVPMTPCAQLREKYLCGASLEPDVAPTVAALLGRFRASPAFSLIESEYHTVLAHRKAWSVAPYPVILVTVDAVVMRSGQVLLIRRGRQPGQGLWALPGGFLDPDETLLDGCVRELREETAITLSAAELTQCLREQRVFDAPDRSVRGRTITHAFYFALPRDAPWKITGSDDAADAQWIPLARFVEMEAQMFEDHYHIVRSFIG